MKTQSIGALFIALVIILAIHPRIVHNIYSSVLGRLLLVGIVVFFAMNNAVLGLLVALTIITASNQFGSFSEGMENITDDKKQIILTASAADAVKKTISQLKENNAEGIDKEDIKNAIASKSSKQIPIDPTMNNSLEVSASSPDILNSTSKSSKEGFGAHSSSKLFYYINK